MLETLVLTGVFAVLIYFSYLDFKTREVDDKLTYGLLGVAVVFQVLLFVFGRQGSTTTLTAFGIMAGLFVIGYLMYLTQQWGGADVLVVAALGGFFGGDPVFTFSLFIDIFIVAFFYSIAWAIFEAVRNPKVKKDFRELVGGDIRELYILIGIMVVGVAGAVVVSASFFGVGIALAMAAPLYWLGFAIPGFWFLLKFVKVVELGCFRIKRKAGELLEYDLMVDDLWMKKGRVVRVPSDEAKGKRKGMDVLVDSSDPNGLTKEKIAKIQKLVKAGKVDDGFVVKWGLPFIPVFPLALVVALIWGNLLGFLF